MKIFNDPEDEPYSKHREIRVHTVVERGLRVRSINRTGQRLAASTTEQMRQFSENDRTMYKMVILQMIDNLNYISAKYAHKRIKLQNPTKEINKKILNYYH